jgi:hypothetical protein
MSQLRGFIGFDQVESVAYHTCAHSIQKRASKPVAIAPIMLSQLQDIYYRNRDPRQSNEFSFSRFLVPYLCDFKGYAIFMDSDMILTTDIHEILQDIDPEAAVSVVKHEYQPSTDTKYLGNNQTRYEKKNWSSVMVFNCAKCKMLTPAYVNNASGLELHQFKWLESDDLIGSLDKEWNHLVGELPENPNAKLIHYTIALPLWPEYMDCEYADEWWREFNNMRHWDKNVIYTYEVKK